LALAQSCRLVPLAAQIPSWSLALACELVLLFQELADLADTCTLGLSMRELRAFCLGPLDQHDLDCPVRLPGDE
jgi:hypothetical protein